jgi:hypothetical protein
MQVNYESINFLDKVDAVASFLIFLTSLEKSVIEDE